MRKSAFGNALLPVLVVITLILLLVGVCVLLLQQKLQLDAYPQGSSLRTDPAGTSIFFNSLARTGVTVIPEFDPANVAKLAPETTALFFIAPLGSFDDDLTADLLRFVDRGGRLVIAGAPPTRWPPPPRKTAAAKKDESQKQKKAEERAEPQLTHVNLWSALRLDLRYKHWHGCDAIPAGNAMPPLPRAAGPIPVTDNSPVLAFKDAGAWQTLYGCGQDAVMAVRQFGRGSVVVASDAAFLSNQQLSQNLDPALMLWVAGGRPQVVADETMHGLSVTHGFAWLVRRYHLGPAILAILVVFLLSIWRSAPSLLPAFRRGSDHESSGTAVVALENERAGYIRLLRRAIPRKELLQVCIREWSLDSGMPVEALRTAAGVPASETQLVERFNDIARVVANANGSNGRPSVAPHSAASGVASDHNAQAAAIHG